MNYRHAYHAGNHTELLKHSALILILRHLAEKPKPFFVLDTHAGLGVYDLASEKALKTREAEGGILRLAKNAGAVAPLLDFVKDFNDNGAITRYPGSPAIIRAHLRANDRMVACELHRDDVETLRRNTFGDPRIGIHHRDGYEAMNALLPPKERRGLVLIDPPYEKTDEEETLLNILLKAHRKWPTGTYMAWYPVKTARPFARLKSGLADSAIPNVLFAEMTLAPADETSLVGGGLIIINPPWQFDAALAETMQSLRAGLRARSGTDIVQWITAST